MPRSDVQILEQISLRKTLFKLVYLRGKTQSDAAKMVGLSFQRVSQIMLETKAEFQERAKMKFDPVEMLSKKLEQLEDIRSESWDSWTRSKENAECSTEERQLKDIYEETVVEGKTQRRKVGETLKIVKAINRVEGRIPENGFLLTVLKCLQEESRLLGLTDDAVVKITNTTNTQVNVGIDWGKMQGPTVLTPDEVEAKISGVITVLPNEVGPAWTDAEMKEMGDETEHLNGDGK